MNCLAPYDDDDKVLKLKMIFIIIVALLYKTFFKAQTIKIRKIL